jgi:alpha-tubulin suppressor-like RCC1 family protein
MRDVAVRQCAIGLGLALLAVGCARIGYDRYALGGGGEGGSSALGGAPGLGGAGQGGVGGQPWPEIHPLGSMVAAGTTHTCALRQGGLYCWGANGNGQLGLGAAGAAQLVPALARGDHWASIHVGDTTSCGLRTDGQVMCWGGNDSGQLGQGDIVERYVATPVVLPAPAISLSLLSTHVCAVLTDGRLFCWGKDLEGQLGLDDAVDSPPQPAPVQVGTAADWQSVSAGEGHTCGLRRPGTLWCWGRNTEGQLGIGSPSPIQIRVPTQISLWDDWVEVHTGSFVTCGIRSGGAGSCWGTNPVGQAVPGAPDPQLSVATPVPGVASFSTLTTFIFHSCGLDPAGLAWCWGRNQEGQLGTGAGSTSERVTKLGTGPWSSIAVGRFHTCVMDSSLRVWCTGANNDGTLGLGDLDRRFSLEQAVF